MRTIHKPLFVTTLLLIGAAFWVVQSSMSNSMAQDSEEHQPIIWEYRHVFVASVKPEELVEKLNELGKERWELAAMGNVSQESPTMFMKRLVVDRR